MYCFNVVGGLNLRSEIVNKRRTRGPLSHTVTHTKKYKMYTNKTKIPDDDDEDEKDGGDEIKTKWNEKR